MQAIDCHGRYFHPHYLLRVTVYVQSDGSILAMSGNVRLELSPDELLDMVNGILE